MTTSNTRKYNSQISMGGNRVYIDQFTEEAQTGHGSDLANHYRIPRPIKTPNIPLSRLVVVDGVTPRRKLDTGLNTARLAGDSVMQHLKTEVSIQEGLQLANADLHDPVLGTFSDSATCAAGDIYIDPNNPSGLLNGVFNAAGDCEIYLHFRDGWEMVHGGKMLAPGFREKFDALLKEVKVFWDREDERFSRGEITKDELFARKRIITETRLIPSEEEMTVDPQSYRTAPIGRYATECIDTNFPPSTPKATYNSHQNGFDGVVLNTDGILVGIDELNHMTSINVERNLPPGLIDLRELSQAHSGADMAGINLCLVPS